MADKTKDLSSSGVSNPANSSVSRRTFLGMVAGAGAVCGADRAMVAGGAPDLDPGGDLSQGAVASGKVLGLCHRAQSRLLTMADFGPRPGIP